MTCCFEGFFHISQASFDHFSQTPGPNVFLDSIATNTYSDIGPHHRYATGQLYDNISGDNINVRNRYNSGTGQ